MRWSTDDRSAPPAWRRIGLALLFVALGCLLSIAFEPWFAMAPLVPFYGVVALSVWFGGALGAVVATLVSILAYSLLVLPPVGGWSLTADDTPRLLIFLGFAALLALLGHSRERAEAELRGSERRLRTMLETANEGIWLIDRDMRTQYANDRMAALLGATTEEVTARGPLDFVFADDVKAARDRFSSVLAGEAAEFDFCLRRADNQGALVRISASPVRDGAGRVVGVLGFYSDVSARRRVEAALSHANERFALAADAVQSLIFDWDVQTGVVERSAALFSLIGYRPEEAESTRAWWHERIHPDDLANPAVSDWLNNLHDDRYEREYRLRHRDGRWITVWEQGRVVRDASGEVVRAIGSVTDITGRIEAEHALRLLDDAGRALASSLDYEETLQRVAWVAVPALADWCFVDLLENDGSVRRVAVAHADASQAELAARAMRFPPVASVSGPTMQVIATGEPMLIECVAETAALKISAQNAEHRAILEAYDALSFISAPLRAGGAIHGALTLFTTSASGRQFDDDDLALIVQLARRSAVAIQNARLFRDVQAAEDRYRGLFEGTKDGIMAVDHRGFCIDANPALTEMAGYSREELVGSAVSLIIQGGPWAGEETDRLRREGHWRGEFDLLRKNGDLLTVESWITRVTLPAGRVYVGVLRDVSERRRFERMQEEFLSSLAHDLKNPLTTVRGQTQLMLRRLQRGELPDPARLTTGLEGIDTAAVRMTKLLDELTDITLLRAGQEIDVQRAPTDLVELARHTIDEYERTTDRHQLVLIAEVDALSGNWDGPRLERVLGNLLGNAIKYSPNGGEITIHVARDGNGAAEAILSVTDRGVGIPEGDRDRVFARYQRAGNVQSIAGSGIGLAGAKRIVELHGGTISVTSTEGEGSTFTVRLPIASEDD